MEIEIEVKGKGRAVARLDPSRNPKIMEELYSKLPIEGAARIWQEEVYFEIPLKLDDENTSPSAEKGDVSYWSPGAALCIFFGDSQPYSAVNHLGKITENIELFADVAEDDKIIVRKLER